MTGRLQLVENISTTNVLNAERAQGTLRTVGIGVVGGTSGMMRTKCHEIKDQSTGPEPTVVFRLEAI